MMSDARASEDGRGGPRGGRDMPFSAAADAVRAACLGMLE